MADLFDFYRHGQSIWLDYIDRRMLNDGGLKAMIDSGLRGVTSNPTIFQKAITGSQDYAEHIRDLLQADPEIDTETLYEHLAIHDVKLAADQLRPVYDSSEGEDGYVSLEVSPRLARDTAATVKAARHLWKAVDRPNLMVKVPATGEGLDAIRQLIGEGININATLLFSRQRYEQVAEAYLHGLTAADDPGRIASVASFFISRVDSKVDARLDEIGSEEARTLKGRIAVNNARLAYQAYRTIFEGSDFQALRERRARPQRLLWGSTGVKNPAYSPLLYVEELIGPNTVNTVPRQTLDLFEERGELRYSLQEDVERAAHEMQRLERLGIDLDRITDELEQEGIDLFIQSYDQLLEALANERFEAARDFAG